MNLTHDGKKVYFLGDQSITTISSGNSQWNGSLDYATNVDSNSNSFNASALGSPISGELEIKLRSDDIYAFQITFNERRTNADTGNTTDSGFSGDIWSHCDFPHPAPDPSQVNHCPTVAAGTSQTIVLPNTASLDGTVSDDSLPNPPATVITTWSKVSGPGTVTFSNPNALETTASFSQAGIYVLRLTAADGGLTNIADVTITVTAPLLLIDRGLHDADGVPGGPTVRLIYDEDLNITWLGDANFGAGSAFDEGTSTTDGAMSWQNAVDWAANLTVGGFTDWRLPTTTQPDLSCSIQSPSGDAGQHCISSELGHLVNTELGGLWFEFFDHQIFPPLGRRVLQRSVPFTNVQQNRIAGDAYWSGTEDSVFPATRAWGFAWGSDNQDLFPKNDVVARFAWAVRDGDVPPVLGVLSQGLLSIVPPSSMAAVIRYLLDPGSFLPEAVLDGRNYTFWQSEAGRSDDIVLALGSNYLVSEVRYLPYSWTKCTQYEVYVSATNGSWGSPVVSGTWANDSTEKTASFPPTPGAYLRIRYLDSYCYTAELNVVGVADVGSGNTPPSVNAGTKQTVTLHSAASLNGTVTDDGLPNPPGSITTAWTRVSGPGTVTFGNTHLVDTTASFSQAGIYVLRLTANDGALSASAEVTITVNPAPPPPPINQAPSVNVGPVQTITLPGTATLNGTVTDDGLPTPPGVVTTLWSKVSGPGVVTFGNPNAVDITATFSSVGTYVLRLTATDGVLSASADVSITVRSQGARKQPTDLNADGTADLLWRNTSNTVVAAWLMNGLTIAASGFFGGVPADWHIEGIGDVDGDEKADVVWKNSSLHVVAIWLMNGLSISSVGFPGGVSSAWQIEGVGDVNGDGKADLIWRNQNGVVAIWLMNGTKIDSPGFLGGVPAEWQIKEVGDVNGDGKADIIWRNSTSGTVAIWVMNGLTILSTGFPGSAAKVWEIEGVGDFDGDGKADLVWHNSGDGSTAIWVMNGTAIAFSGFPGAMSSEWKIAQVGDVDGDGKADLVLRNNLTSAVEVWIMNGLGITTTGSPGAASTDWEIQ